MTTRCCPMLTAAWLMSAAPLAQAGDGTLSVSDGSSALVASVDEGWTMGASGAPAPARGDEWRQALAGMNRTLPAAGAAATGGTEVFAGYHGTAGALGYGAQLRVRGNPGLQAAAGGARQLDETDGHAELSAGVHWKSLYARYDVTLSHDYLGIRGARGTGYLDVGARHPIGNATFLNLHAGDARVAGIGNGAWNWRDLRAGFSRKLDDGWMMVLNVRRVYGNNVLADRRGAFLRSEGHNPALVRGRRGLVLTFKRGF